MRVMKRDTKNKKQKRICYRSLILASSTTAKPIVCHHTVSRVATATNNIATMCVRFGESMAQLLLLLLLMLLIIVGACLAEQQFRGGIHKCHSMLRSMYAPPFQAQITTHMHCQSVSANMTATIFNNAITFKGISIGCTASIQKC